MDVQSRGEKIFDGFNVLLLTVFSMSIIIPFYFVLTGTLVSESEYLNSSGFVFWPQNVTFEAYKIFFNDTFGLIRAYGISISRVVVGTALNIIFTSALAYVLSKKRLPGRNFLIIMVFITMYFSGGLIPNFMLVKTLGLRDTFWAMILPGQVNYTIYPGLIGSFYMIILKNFFAQVPESLEESAHLDGAGELTILFRIIIPLSLPSITTIALFYAVAHWNAWFDASIYINNEKLYPLQLVLRKIIIQEDFTNQNPNAIKSVVAQIMRKPSSYALKNTAIFYTALPIICAYPFVQKYFVKGVLTGSIKG